jgi:RNA polymerase sigma-70 factor (ECF subfamily)
VDEALDLVYRTERGRVLARLIAVVKDFDLAEDAVQDAFVAAAGAWAVSGITGPGVSWPSPGTPGRPRGRSRTTGCG